MSNQELQFRLEGELFGNGATPDRIYVDEAGFVVAKYSSANPFSSKSLIEGNQFDAKGFEFVFSARMCDGRYIFYKPKNL